MASRIEGNYTTRARSQAKNLFTSLLIPNFCFRRHKKTEEIRSWLSLCPFWSHQILHQTVLSCGVFLSDRLLAFTSQYQCMHWIRFLLIPHFEEHNHRYVVGAEQRKSDLTWRLTNGSCVRCEPPRFCFQHPKYFDNGLSERFVSGFHSGTLSHNWFRGIILTMMTSF